MAIGTMAALAGAAAAGKGIASGVSRAVGGTALFSEDDERRLRSLEARARSGQLGLSDVRRARLENQQAVERGGMLRNQQAQSAAAMQGLANQQAISGRDLFLAQMAQQEGEAQLRGAQAMAIAQQDIEAARQQRAQMQQLRQMEKARKQEVRAGITQALTAGLFGAGQGFVDYKLDAMKAQDAAEQEQADQGRLQLAPQQTFSFEDLQNRGFSSNIAGSYGFGTTTTTGG